MLSPIRNITKVTYPLHRCSRCHKLILSGTHSKCMIDSKRSANHAEKKTRYEESQPGNTESHILDTRVHIDSNFNSVHVVKLIDVYA